MKKDPVRIMLCCPGNRMVETITTEEELYNKVMTGVWKRNAFLDGQAENPKKLPVFETKEEQ